MKSAISYISKRYSKTSNKYLRSFDTKQELNYVIFLNINNLYGYVMSKFLPAGKLKWVDPKEFNFNKYSRDSSKRSVLDVHPEYPKNIITTSA